MIWAHKAIGVVGFAISLFSCIKIEDKEDEHMVMCM